MASHTPLLRLVVLAALILSASAASADVVWPALYLETRLLTWYSVLGGLVAEYVSLLFAFRMPARRALFAVVAMNVASTVLGIILIPLAGVAWEVFPGLLLYHGFNIGTFNPGTWVATVLLAAAINALLEAGVLHRFFHLPFTRRTVAWLFLANLVSVGLAMFSLWRYPVEH